MSKRKHLEEVSEGGVHCGVGDKGQGVEGQELSGLAERSPPSLQVMLEVGDPSFKLCPVLYDDIYIFYM